MLMTSLRPRLLRTSRRRTARARRGVTLLELMVVVALLVLIMAILVEIFRSATGALSSQRAFAGIDQELRRIGGMLRQDLGHITAKMDPQVIKGDPFTAAGNNPTEDRGYFSYGENALADAQGEDTDDYLAFTAELPADSPPFTGFIAVPSVFGGPAGQPTVFNRVPVTSRRAEVVYFLRNGNLYRRVFLILSSTTPLSLGWNTAGGGFVHFFETTRPPSMPLGGPLLTPGTGLLNVPISWLGANDVSARPGSALSSTGAPVLNTLGDLTNRENRAFNPRFTNDLVNNTTLAIGPDGVPDRRPDWPKIEIFYKTLYPNSFNVVGLQDPTIQSHITSNPQLLSFPFIYPNGYSAPDNFVGSQPIGAIHNLASTTGNHAPLDLGDPLAQPPFTTGIPTAPSTTGTQTWWGFPTKKETMSFYWTDPVRRVNADYILGPPFNVNEPSGRQSLGLRPAFPFMSAGGPTFLDAVLPPINTTLRNLANPPLFLDDAGTGVANSTAFTAWPLSTLLPNPPSPDEIWRALPEDDLVLSNVRSFDVKGLDPVSQQYVDLGYLQSLSGTPLIQQYTLGHEGRIPPLVADNRINPQTGSAGIGDDAATVVRLRRVWDSWSTDYSRVPPVPPSSIEPPIYPSYPPPYPVPLRGVQIQIRVVDPTNQKIKSHTLRMDFAKNLD